MHFPNTVIFFVRKGSCCTCFKLSLNYLSLPWFIRIDVSVFHTILLCLLASYSFCPWDYFHVNTARAVNFNQFCTPPSSLPPPPLHCKTLLSLLIKAARDAPSIYFLSIHVIFKARLPICHFAWSSSVCFFSPHLFLFANANISLSPCDGCKLSEVANGSLSERVRHMQFLRLLWQRTLRTSLSAPFGLCGSSSSASFPPRLSRFCMKDFVFRTLGRMFLPYKGRAVNTS